MLFQVSKYIEPPKTSWEDRVKKQIFRRNMVSIKEHQNNRLKMDHNEALVSINSLFSKHHTMKIVEHSQATTGHSYYSNFIPLKAETRFSDQLRNTIPYFAYLSDKGHFKTLRRHYEQISEHMRSSKENGKTEQGWTLTLRKYLCPLDITESIKVYLALLRKGTPTLKEEYTRCGVQCLPEVFLHHVMQAREYFCKESRVNRHSSSIENWEAVDEASLAKTMKELFCSLCLTYDCGYHAIDESACLNNFQYVSPKNSIPAKDNVIKAMETYECYQRIMKDVQMRDGVAACSPDCCRKVDLAQWNRLQKEPRKLFSQVMKSIVRIGIQLFSYNPCKITPLFPPQVNISCSQILLFLIEQENIYAKVLRKMASTEVDYLKTEYSIEPIKIKHKKGTAWKAKQTKKQSDNGNTVASISTCVHHFKDTEFDVNCERCICQRRGYCLAQCLCGDQCLIMKKGCDCRKENDCRSNKCSCFSNSTECDPNSCVNCFPQVSQKQRSCRNSQLLHQERRMVRVGESTIVNAGLGLFAGQDIEKDQLVIEYVGEIINSQIDQLRQTMSYDLSFYNFGSQETIVDARFAGNKSRFMNHGDLGADNVEAKIISSGGRTRIGFFSKRNIRFEEQLLFDYDGTGELFKNHKNKYPFIQSKKRANKSLRGDSQ